MSKKIKVFAIVVLCIALIIGAIAVFGNSSSNAPSSSSPLSSSVGGDSPAAGVALNSGSAPTEFSVLLSTIKSIDIDTSLFSDPAYRALRDYPITLGSDIRGRPNPFAPVGYDSGSISTIAPVAQPQFETIQPSSVTATTAQFGAQGILSNTAQATVIFEYGINDLLGSATAPIPLGANGTVLYRVSGLTPSTTYHVQAVLAQGSTTTPGNTMTFTTLAK